MAARWLRWRVRGPRPQDECAQVDRHACRPDLRVALAAPRIRGSLCLRRFQGEVRERLRRSLEQGHERRSIRPRLISRRKGFCYIEVTQILRQPVQALDGGDSLDKKSGRRFKTI